MTSPPANRTRRHRRTTRYIALVGTSWVKKADGAVKTDWLRCVAVFVSMLRRQRPDRGHCTSQPAATRAKHPVYLGQTGGATPQESRLRSEEHTSELQSLMRISYAVFCLQQQK